MQEFAFHSQTLTHKEKYYLSILVIFTHQPSLAYWVSTLLQRNYSYRPYRGLGIVAS